MVSIVQAAKAPLMVLWIMWSVFMSTEAVASSSTRILFLNNAKKGNVKFAAHGGFLFYISSEM